MSDYPAQLSTHLQRISPLSVASLALLVGRVTLRELAKNEVLLCEGQRCQAYFLVAEGHLRTVRRLRGRSVCTLFTFEGHFVTSLHSLKNQLPSTCALLAGEPTLVWVFERVLFRASCQDRPDILLLSRRILADLYRRAELRGDLLNLLSLAERYQHLLATQPELGRRVPLVHLASYLGSSREALSRVRAKKAK